MSWSSQSEQSSEEAEHLLGMDWLDVDGHSIADWPMGVKLRSLVMWKGSVLFLLGFLAIKAFTSFQLPDPAEC